jgi:hypothetical protein
MTNPKSRIFAAVAGALAMGATAAWAADATQDSKIQDLQNKVTALEAKQAQSSKDVAATIDAVLRDAERRSQLLANGDTGAGYDGNFYIRAGEGWDLKPGFNFQFRNNTDFRSNTAKSDQTENGFEVRRMQLILAGHAFTKDLEYYIQWNVDRDSGTTFLEDAWVRYMFADDWGVRAGQFKDQVTHEKTTSDAKLIAVERSLQDAVMGGGVLDRVQGVNLIYGGRDEKNPINIEFGIHDGAKSLNTDYTKHAYDFGVAARGEWKAMGKWKNYQDLTAKDTKEDLLVLALAGDLSQAGDDDQFVGTIDAQWENTTGWGAYGAIVVRNTDGALSADGKSNTDWSGLIQLSYLVNPQWEVFGRYTYIGLDNEIAFADGTKEDTFHEISVGVVYYLGKDGSAGHRAKVTVDLNYLPNGSPSAQKGLGYLGDSNGDNEIVLRGQFQLFL